VLEPRVELVRRALASEFGCDPEELAVVRNASEAMETLIFGLDLRPGDEVIVTTQNYDRMLTAWDQRALRDGIVVRRVVLSVPPASDEAVVALITAAITPRTRVIELPHLTNWTGQPLPVRAVVDLARPHGIEVLVDGAQTFAHTPVTRDALGCDYYGTSLHKWLLAPLGTGFLYVRREKIGGVWPLFAAAATKSGDIRKFEEIGTHPAAAHNAVIAALAFHRAIGPTRKLARLRALRDRWARALAADAPRVHIRTPLDDPRSGAIALVEIEGVDPVPLAQWLWAHHRIVTSPVSFGGVTGLRITPNVFTTTREIDLTTDAVRHALRTGLR
jgi:selenocysteine lyase/cysteine desulfurase